MPFIALPRVKKECDSCVYYDMFVEGLEEDTGICTRFPPHAIPDGAEYPTVSKDCVICGEFEPSDYATGMRNYASLFELMPPEIGEKLKAKLDEDGIDNWDDVSHLFREPLRSRSGFGIVEESWLAHAMLQLSHEFTRWDDFLVEETKQYRQEHFDEFWEYLS